MAKHTNNGWHDPKHGIARGQGSRWSKNITIERVRQRNGDHLELNIKKYNESIQRMSEAQKAFSIGRRKADDLAEQRRLARELKEVWD